MVFQSLNVLPVLPKPHNGPCGPRGPTLSGPEDKEMKKKLRNRESALAARERKKQKMLELERKVSELGKENDDLRSENSLLKNTLSSIMKKYGADENEIEEALKIAEAKKLIKKEPLGDHGITTGSPDKNKTEKRILSTKTPSGAFTQKCRKVIKQENCDPTIKIPKNNSNSGNQTGNGTRIQLTTKNGQQIIGQKIGSNFIFHKNQIILDSSKISFKNTTSGHNNVTSGPVRSEYQPVKPSDQNIKQEPQDTTSRRVSYETPSQYSPPWTPPDLSTMQNSPSSSDSAYSTGSENGGNQPFSANQSNTNQTGNQIQLLPLRLPEKRSRVETDFYDESSGTKFQIMDTSGHTAGYGETLYDTEITFTESYSTTRTTPSTRVPKFHSHHELTSGLTSGELENSNSNHWLGMLQNNDVQFSPSSNNQPSDVTSGSSLKPEDFLTQIEQPEVHQTESEIKIENGNLLDSADTTFENIPSQPEVHQNTTGSNSNSDFNQTFLQKPVLNVDDFIFGQF